MHTILLQGHSDTDMMLIVKLAEKMKIDVLPLSMNEIEEIEDLKLLRVMRKAREEGLADRTQTLEKLGL